MMVGRRFLPDPPYFETVGYRFDLVLEGHKCLADILKSIQGKFMLSINDHEVMRDMYREFKIDEAEVQYSIALEIDDRGKYDELLIRNYEEELRLEL